jgi:hypothetical protein
VKRKPPVVARPRATKKTAARKPALRAKPPRAPRRKDVLEVTKTELESLRREVAQASGGGPARWNADPDDVQKSVARLVLALVEFLRKVMERQAIRRMEAGTLEAAQVESMGLALMRLEETVRDMAAQFGLDPEELNLDLGPLGKLM